MSNQVSSPELSTFEATEAVTAPDNADASVVRDLVRALRPYQWVKNLLLFLPLLMSHQVGNFERVAAVATGFIAFCLCASASYVLNDLWDREHDRHHPVKRNRPFAAGRLSARAGVAMIVGLFTAGVGISIFRMSPGFTAMLIAYVVITTVYSFWLKRKLLLDVFFLAGLYTHRVLAGGIAADVIVSPWLLAFCIFFFLSLAYAKRYAELLRVQEELGEQIRGRAYRVEDLEIVDGVGPASGYMSVLVLALYVNSNRAGQLYQSPSLLWLVCPVMLYWITRIWFLARRRALMEDPLLFAIKDRASLLVATILAAVLATAWVGVPGLDNRNTGRDLRELTSP